MLDRLKWKKIKTKTKQWKLNETKNLSGPFQKKLKDWYIKGTKHIFLSLSEFSTLIAFLIVYHTVFFFVLSRIVVWGTTLNGWRTSCISCCSYFLMNNKIKFVKHTGIFFKRHMNQLCVFVRLFVFFFFF